MEHDILAIIPARGGSKSVPGKNIAMLGGKALIAHTIETARKAKRVDRVIVSTDVQEIADVAVAAGAEAPFLRPAELARDATPGIAPVLHAVNWLAENDGYRPELVVMLQPTSPFRTAGDIDAAIRLACERDADAVVSVCPAPKHPFWMKTITADGRLADMLLSDCSYSRRQDLPEAYCLNGAIFLARKRVLMEKRTWYTDKTFAYVMPEERSLDIDTAWDLHLARLIVEAKART